MEPTTPQPEQKSDSSMPVKQAKVFHGIVVSDKADKTIIVRVSRMVKNRKYHRQFEVSKKFAVHDQDNEYTVGDEVKFVQTRPLSKQKRWRVVK